jgi:proline iminopeptidase
VLRGIFMLRKWEIDWFYQDGAGALFPDRWENYLAAIPRRERGDLVGAYYRRLTSPNRATRVRAARAWSIWEAATSHLLPDEANIEKWSEEDFAVAVARIECHYFVNKGFLRSEDQLLRGVARIRHIPSVIVQGRYDVVCPPASADDLHRAWPAADYFVVPDAGHSAFEPGTRARLVATMDALAKKLG